MIMRNVARVALLVVLAAACARDADLSYVGGNWWTAYTSNYPRGGHIPRVLLRIKNGKRVVVDSTVEHVHHYLPDCVAYQSGQHEHDVMLACGDRQPLAIAETVAGEWEMEKLGLRRGSMTLPIDSLRALATHQPPRQ